MTDHEATELATRLDVAYKKYVDARYAARYACRQMVVVALELAEVILMTRGSVRGSFVRWCRIHCRKYDPNEGRAVSAVAARDGVGQNDRIETWVLRLLRVISPIHHSARPMAKKRKVKTQSWISGITATRDKVNKLIDQAGGVENMDVSTRDAIARNLNIFDEIKSKLQVSHK